MKFLSILFTLSLAHPVMGCLTTFNETFDYFQDNKIQGEHDGFSVEYHNYYKRITINAFDTEIVYIAYLCGSRKPDIDEDHIPVQIPPKSFGWQSTTETGYFLHLLEGRFDSPHYISSEYTILPSCMKAYYSDRSWEQLGENASDVFFVDYVLDINEVVNISDWPNGKSKIKIGQIGSQTPLEQFQWIQYIAAFLNLDSKSNTIVQTLRESYDCIKRIKDHAVDRYRPNVLILDYYVDGIHVEGDQHFSVKAILDAGAFPVNNRLNEGHYTVETVIDSVFDVVDQLDFILVHSKADHSFYVDDHIAKDTHLLMVKEVNSRNSGNDVKMYDLKDYGDYFFGQKTFPELYLSDLVKIFHPSLIDHELQFFNTFYPLNSNMTSNLLEESCSMSVTCEYSSSSYTVFHSLFAIHFVISFIILN
jgi:iron complex transport system substrate-binding protein